MQTIPLCCDAPHLAFRRLAGEPWAMLLDSAARHPARGRFSIIVAGPFATVEATDAVTRRDGTPVKVDPWTCLENALAEAKGLMQPAHSALPFSGGAVGTLGYELGRHLERLPGRHPNPFAVPDMSMGFYDTAAVFDHARKEAVVVAARPEALPEARRLAELLERPAADPGPLPPPASWRSELSRVDYLERVAQVGEYIRAGDVYQANFTQRFLAPAPPDGSAFAVHERLRSLSPAPFGAFLNLGPRLKVLSASPERFVSLSRDGVIESRPIKGTIARRPDDAEADARAARALAESVKDRAENLMITDLLRNDLGRVAELGSVRVPTLRGIESFANVHHLVSMVTARLKPGLGPVDLLRAAFPGGSITGAPKLRAMEIIDELEAARRGPYCGSVAWIGFDGAMDTSIVIRTLCLTEEGAIAQAGGGIVADSIPEREHAEMILKATPSLRALAPDWNP